MATKRFNGVHTLALDASRRVAIPPAWKPEDPNEELTLILWHKEDVGDYLKVVSDEKFNALLDSIEQGTEDNEAKEEMKRLIGRRSVTVPIDAKTRRIAIPEFMAAPAGITPSSKVVFVGNMDFYEIWSEDRNAQMEKSEKSSAGMALFKKLRV